MPRKPKTKKCQAERWYWDQWSQRDSDASIRELATMSNVQFKQFRRFFMRTYAVARLQDPKRHSDMHDTLERFLWVFDRLPHITNRARARQRFTVRMWQ